MRKVLGLILAASFAAATVTAAAEPLDGSVNGMGFPLSYPVEHTGADCPKPPLPALHELPIIMSLPNPFEWSDGSGVITRREEWRCRRAEIAEEIQHYQLGYKPPRPEELEASFSREEQLLKVKVRDHGAELTLTAKVTLPEGQGPFPALIGVGWGTGSLPPDLVLSRPIATVAFNFLEISDVYPDKETQPFYQAFKTDIGKYAAWAWGISRIIDGLEMVKEQLNLDTSRIAVTGCSFAGKIALYAGAFDERIALTIAQEPGGGGAAAWRVTQSLPGERETLARTTRSWYRPEFFQFADAVARLPYDHHELMAMVAPRALFVLGNPDYEWLAEESAYVSSMAAKKVWEALGVPERFGFSIVAGHPHCMVPESQRAEVAAFLDRFLLGDESVETEIVRTPYSTDLARWITWDRPVLE